MKKSFLDDKKYYLVPIFLCLIGLVFFLYYYFFTGFTHSTTTQYLYIDDDDTADSVYTKLKDVGSQHGATAVATLLRHIDYENSLRTGRYEVKSDVGVIELFRRLKNGQQTPLMLTIPESRTMEKLAAALSKRIMLDSATIVSAFTDSAFCSAIGYTTQTIPALFVPNTYEVYWDISIEKLAERMKREHDAFWNYERMHKAEAIALSPNEVATLASIIDEETANNAEKPMIAGMYLNRLKENMPLQADPTVKFALGDFAIKRVRHGMLTTDSPYNTYKYEGLPPGPIKIASIKGIDAVLNRVSHNYLYMCAKEDFSGTHNFAATYNEHLKNAARYAKALNERGIE